ncbi:MAG: acyl carrier protein [Lachnospiraceae bacterium]|nr:acyl carrier protein [Lachnospiraceae bacterium]MBR6271713.1 acyl carrier protein [Lachnospiraceae bacterium]
MDLKLMQEIVAEVLDIDPAEVTTDKNFEKDLGANSLDRVEIVMKLEDELGVQVPDEDLEGIVTVGDAVAKLEKLL